MKKNQQMYQPIFERMEEKFLEETTIEPGKRYPIMSRNRNPKMPGRRFAYLGEDWHVYIGRIGKPLKVAMMKG